jgi:hypothetical protein
LKVIYISGPITNDPDYRRKFNRMENEIQVQAFTVLNPVHLPAGMTDGQYMKICLAMIDAADAVIVLAHWLKTRGSRLETNYCLYTGKTVYLTLEGLLDAHRKEVGADATPAT